MSPADSPSSRDAQLAALLAAPAPRVVPAELRRAGARQATPVSLAILGAFFAGLGLVMGSVFFPWNFYRDWQLSTPGTATVTGRVVSVRNTSLSINRRKVVRYDFTFKTATGATGSGSCYTTGQQWNPNATVTVRYRPEDPEVACILGARLSEASAVVLPMLILPGAGVALLAWFVVSRRRIRSLLERGTVGEALVTAVDQTLMQMNKRYVFKISLQRTDAPDAGALTLRSYDPAVISFAQERLASQQPVFVLYDPANPKRTLLPETL
jgi:hypothetical protein